MNAQTTPEQLGARSPPNRDSVSSFGSSHSRSLSSNKKNLTSIQANLLPSAPASPPTPAPSPTPHQRPPNWHSSDEEENSFLLNLRIHFSTLSNARKQKFLEGILDVCDSQQLSFVSSYVAPRLRKDPFLVFPNELCLRVIYPVGHSLVAANQRPLSGTILHRRPEDTGKSIASLEAVAGTLK